MILSLRTKLQFKQPTFVNFILLHHGSASAINITSSEIRDTVSLPSCGKIAAHTSAEGTCIAVFEDGTICKLTLHESTSIENQEDHRLELKMEHFKLDFHEPHFVATNTDSGYVGHMVICTKSHLLLIAIQDGKIEAKVRKYYTAGRIPKDTEKIFAYVHGTVDVFELLGHEKKKIRLLVSIDAHGAPITKLFIPGRECKFISFSV